LEPRKRFYDIRSFLVFVKEESRTFYEWSFSGSSDSGTSGRKYNNFGEIHRSREIRAVWATHAFAAIGLDLT
jgi:hypothetical protein